MEVVLRNFVLRRRPPKFYDGTKKPDPFLDRVSRGRVGDYLLLVLGLLLVLASSAPGWMAARSSLVVAGFGGLLVTYWRRMKTIIFDRLTSNSCWSASIWMDSFRSSSQRKVTIEDLGLRVGLDMAVGVWVWILDSVPDSAVSVIHCR